jgi:light-independent protochlorophyllide reductase subunit B
MMGLEEHLLGMFREDFEFHDQAAPSHLGGTQPRAAQAAPAPVAPIALVAPDAPVAAAQSAALVAAQGEATAPAWSDDAERELGKVPFFVRGKARRNTERYAEERGVACITIETLYDAKAHYAR